MEIKKYDKVPLTQAVKSSSSSDFKPPPPQSTPPKAEPVTIQKTKSTVSIKNKKGSILDKSFTKEESPQIPAKVFFIRTKDNNDLKIPLEQVFHFTILELKKFSFPTFFDENKNIRFICRGKLLQDADLVSKSNIKVGDFIHAFISEKVEKKLNTSNTNTTNISNFENSRSNNIRGFDRMREYGVSEQEMVLQRFKYHSHYSLIEKEDDLEMTNLVNREDEWFALHLEQITTDVVNAGKWFKGYKFYDDINQDLRLNGNYFELAMGVVVGFFVVVMVLLFIFCKKELSYRAKEGLLLGMVVKLIYISLHFYLAGEIRWLV